MTSAQRYVTSASHNQSRSWNVHPRSDCTEFDGIDRGSCDCGFEHDLKDFFKERTINGVQVISQVGYLIK